MPDLPTNASTFADATSLTGLSFLARLDGGWINAPAPLLTNAAVNNKTANATLLVTDSGGLFTNLGASGAITLTLPAATVGLRFRFHVAAVQQLRVDPSGSEVITGGTAGQYYWADAVAENLELTCIETGKWAVTRKEGTWNFV